jgi:hypothetical protein
MLLALAWKCAEAPLTPATCPGFPLQGERVCDAQAEASFPLAPGRSSHPLCAGPVRGPRGWTEPLPVPAADSPLPITPQPVSGEGIPLDVTPIPFDSREAYLAQVEAEITVVLPSGPETAGADIYVAFVFTAITPGDNPDRRLKGRW